jgi:hypothetical protein
MQERLFEKLIVSQLVRKFYTFNGTLRLITLFTKARATCPYTKPDQTTIVRFNSTKR